MSFFGDDFFGVELAGVELSGDDFFGGEVSCYRENPLLRHFYSCIKSLQALVLL